MKGKKKIVIAIISVIALIAIGLVVFFLVRKKPVTDIVMKENEVIFNVDRQFYLYDKDPSDKKNGKVKPIREIKAIFNGTGNIKTHEYDGQVIVEDFELGGNFKSYYFEKDKKECHLTCEGVNLNDREAVEGERYAYSISISPDFRDIKIWIYELDEGDDGEYYWVLNNGY